MTGATRRQLEYWARLGLLRPKARWGERFFSFADLVAVETLNRLAERRIPVRRLCRAMEALERQLGNAEAPLASLRVSTNGTQIVVHESGRGKGPIEPLSGQFVLNFAMAPLEKKIHALGKRTAEEWFELATICENKPEMLQEAAHAYGQAIAAEPGWLEAHINLGTALFQMGSHSESRDAFAAAVRLDPASALAHFNLGCASDRLGDTIAAIQEFRLAIARAPEMADAHLNLALSYEKSGDAADAQRHFATYLRHEPQGVWAEFARSRIAPKLRTVPRDNITPFRSVRR